MMDGDEYPPRNNLCACISSNWLRSSALALFEILNGCPWLPSAHKKIKAAGKEASWIISYTRQVGTWSGGIFSETGVSIGNLQSHFSCLSVPFFGSPSTSQAQIRHTMIDHVVSLFLCFMLQFETLRGRHAPAISTTHGINAFTEVLQ